MDDFEEDEYAFECTCCCCLGECDPYLDDDEDDE